MSFGFEVRLRQAAHRTSSIALFLLRTYTKMPRNRGGGRGRGGGGRPPGLKGKEIGLYYAARGRQRRADNDRQNRNVVHLSDNDSNRISSMLNRLDAIDRVPPQPLRTELEAETSGASADNGATASQKVLDFMEEDDDMLLIDEEMEELLQHNDINASVSNNIQQFPELRRDPVNDQRALEQLKRTTESPGYLRMLQYRQELPAFNMREQLLSSVASRQVTIISGETGCGKTTQVPQYLLEYTIENNMGSLCNIVVTQPRRISAISVAHRVSEERGESLGNSIGYQIRLESVMPKRYSTGTIIFCTTGIVLQRMQGDEGLNHLSHLIVDEIHERDLHTDFLLVLLKDLLPKRPDLKVILMSATMNAHRFANYFNLPESVIVHIPGRTFPVTSYDLENTLQMMNFYPDPNLLTDMQKKSRSSFRHGRRSHEKDYQAEISQNYDAYLRGHRFANDRIRTFLEALGWKNRPPNSFVADVVGHILTSSQEGAILIFVPGWSDIKEVTTDLENRIIPRLGSVRVHVYPLHSLMPTVNQREIFNRPPQGVRKVIVATNIAETSITIDDVVYVVDCGQIKITQYDPMTHTNVLQPVLVTRANATQREGRAGRVQSGFCYHLYSSFQRDFLMEKELPPEMLRTRLEEVILQIKILKLGDAAVFLNKALDPPSEGGIKRALTFLRKINALTQGEEELLTPLGRHLARLPVDCQCGKMILLGALFGCLDPILSVAAGLGYKDPFHMPMGKERLVDERRYVLANGSFSDHILLSNVIDEYERLARRGTAREFLWKNFLSEPVLKQLIGMKKQFAQMLYDFGYIGTPDPHDAASNRHSSNESLVKALICSGLYPNVGKVSDNRGRKVDISPIFGPPNDIKMAIHPKSIAKHIIVYRDVWLVYFLRMRLGDNAKKAFIFDATPVGTMSLLFFGGQLRSSHDHGRHGISIDDWIKFYIGNKDTFRILKDLRRRLDEILERKSILPSPINWDDNSAESHIMSAIVELLCRPD